MRRVAVQLSNPIVLTLLAAAGVSFVFKPEGEASSFLQSYADPLAILLIVFLNATLGLVQESKAGAAVAALGKLAVPHARVRRAGRSLDVSSEELVPGDVLELEAGDAISADSRIIHATELQVEEASLTGESVPVKKDHEARPPERAELAERANMLFLGTAVTRGAATAVVTATGLHTELGRIGSLIASTEKAKTPLEEMLAEFGQRVLWGCLVLSVVLFGWGMLKPALFGGPAEPWAILFLGAVSLAVAAIPEGLPAITTITLALGTERLARRGAIVRRLAAVETLGAATFICTDKTGTLTQNVMMVRSVWTPYGVYTVEGDGYGPEGSIRASDGQTLVAGAPAAAAIEKLVTAAVTCNHAAVAEVGSRWRPIGDPTEAALVTLGERVGVSVKRLRGAHPIVREVPFESARRCMTVVTEARGERGVFMKGALDVVLDRSTRLVDSSGAARSLGSEALSAIESAAEEMARRGLRVLGFASKVERGADLENDVEHDLEFLGFVGIMDPPRSGVTEALASCRKAGISVAMVTGDHPTTATAIAREIGLFTDGDRVLTGAELESLSEAELTECAPKVRVFARTSPEQKLRILRAIKASGHVVAMTGDGVNDAPALREAHIGVAMGQGGTEVARQAADLILVDDDFSTIVRAIHEGRVIYRNIQKFIFFLLSANAGLCGSVFLTALIADWPPLTPLMLLWVNLVTNGLPALALGVDPPGEDVMAGSPRKLGEPILLARDWASIGVVGVVMTASSALFHVSSGEPLEARALGFSYLALGALLHAYSCASHDSVLFKLAVFRRPLTLAVLFSATLHAVTFLPVLRPVFKTYPLDGAEVVKLGLLCLLVVPAVEIWKWVLRRGR